ncbi:outer membrane protein assembly factor BamD [Marinobacterium sp. AK62]|uniref:Outer membrane protein assembly factor BamD n=1 Tax=Marinobacterium alkalitolerans TaxID=1542925 RepID=A0ABS3ZC57_9GAMM|nr:outer membrane protein assembly factor BamD [Marinobacterium alkalitolerans]MBP0049281.1 outer membrane protein assembly factor BamD [Marinobacterium alkalitolerans]
MRPLKLLVTLVLFSLLSACSWFGGDEKVAPDVPEQQLYDEALSALEADNYELAVEKLQLLEARYPFGRYSEQAQLELIYAYFRNYEPESASAAADRFIRLHPNHDNIDYAYYLKGLTAFEQDRSFLEKYLPIDVSQRDPGAALESFESFSTLLNRYPDSEYAPDAQKRMQYLKNRLAAHEIHVAAYYMKREAWVAAANRGRYVVENLQETPAVPDALAIMAEAYTELGMHDLANNSREVLQLNYPEYEVRPFKQRSATLLQTATFGLLGGEPPAEPARPVPLADRQRADAQSRASDEKAEQEERSWFSRMTFGVFDDEEESAPAE